MNTFHLVYVPFTGLGLHGGYRGDKWLENRIQIFKQFVLPSLLAQTTRDWTLWVSWRPEDKENPIVQDFAQTLSYVRGLSFVFTYGGVCFWDDKYDDKTAEKRLRESLEVNLRELAPLIPDCYQVAVTLQPSDDMYLPGSFEQMLEAGALYTVYKKGYIMRYATKEIAEYNPDTTPPFYTIRYPKHVFLDPALHYTYIGPYQSHEFVGDAFKESTVTLENRGFIVGTHGENISTTFNHPYQGRRLDEEETERLLIITGNFFTPALSLPISPHLRLREIANRLPFTGLLKRIYRTLKWKFY